MQCEKFFLHITMMCFRMMFCPIIGIIQLAGLPVHGELMLAFPKCSQCNLMSMALVCLGCALPLITPSAIAFSVCNGVGGCTWPSSTSMILIYGFASHYVQASEFCFGCWKHNVLNDVCYVQYYPIVWWDSCIAWKEEVPPCSASCLWLAQVAGIAVYC
jgi:hypothetical protein